MSKADVVQFFWNALQLLLTIIVYAWPFGTLIGWVRWWSIFKNDQTTFHDKSDDAFAAAMFMTVVMCVAIAVLFWFSLPDTRIVPSVNAR